MKRRYWLLGVIVLLLFIHILFPKLGIDSISLWLIAFSVILIFLPELQNVLPYVKSFKAAGAEVELRESVDKAWNKNLPKVAKNLVNNLEDPKDKEAIQHNKDIIQKQLDEVFKAGLSMGDIFKNRPITDIGNVKLLKNDDGTTAIQWDEA